jgi:hypothetical protein
MKVPSIMTNDELEQLYEKIGEDTINLPTKFKKLRLGLLPRICQLLITALKPNPNKKVKFFQFDSTKENIINELLEDPQSLTALMMSDQVFEKDIDIDGDKQPKELKSTINQDIQRRLNESIYKRGHRVQLFSVDHSDKKYALPSCFYIPEGTNQLRQSAFYNSLIKRFVEISPTPKDLSIEDLIDLGEMLFELIENTEQHSKLEFDIGKVKKSVRGVVIDHKLIIKEHTSESIGGDGTAITKYLDGIREENKTVHLLEISVFDSGEGIFQSLCSNTDEQGVLQKEVELVQKSFAKGITSKANSKGYGRGLFNVREVLDKRKGFISIRTGVLGLYRDFNRLPLSEEEKEPLLLLDENNQSTDSYSKLASVEGLAYSILVPLR